MNNVTFGHNVFCGPSVMSAILGITTDEAEAIIKSVTGQKTDVRAVYMSDLISAFKLTGAKVYPLAPLGSKSIFFELFRIKEDGYYVFMVPGHFVAIEINENHKFICDNHTKEPISVSSSSRLSQKVIGIIKVTKNDQET